MQERQ